MKITLKQEILGIPAGTEGYMYKIGNCKFLNYYIYPNKIMKIVNPISMFSVKMSYAKSHPELFEIKEE